MAKQKGSGPTACERYVTSRTDLVRYLAVRAERKAIRELRAALAAIIADHDERVSAWGESEQQPHRVAGMEHGRTVLARYPEEPDHA